MNLGGMVTVGRRRPKNLVWMILENGVFLETGAQPIASVENADLVGLAWTRRAHPTQPALLVEVPDELAEVAEGHAGVVGATRGSRP